jgi:hypothetical protein
MTFGTFLLLLQRRSSSEQKRARGGLNNHTGYILKVVLWSKDSLLSLISYKASYAEYSLSKKCVYLKVDRVGISLLYV